MVFTSTAFLFAFLPVAVLTYYVFPASLRAVPLLVLSCLFYGWGEPVLVVLILASSLLNFVWGRLLQRPRLRHPRLLLAVGIAFDLVPIAVFKYLDFVLRSIGLGRCRRPDGPAAADRRLLLHVHGRSAT